MGYLRFFSTLNKLLKKQKLRELKVALCGSDSIFFFFVPIIARPLTQTSYRNFSPGVRSLSRVRCLFPEPNQSTSKTRPSDTKKPNQPNMFKHCKHCLNIFGAIRIYVWYGCIALWASEQKAGWVLPLRLLWLKKHLKTLQEWFLDKDNTNSNKKTWTSSKKLSCWLTLFLPRPRKV